MGRKAGTAVQALGTARGYPCTETVWRQRGARVIFTSSGNISELKLWRFFVHLEE